MQKQKPNELCRCGSSKKFKKCCAMPSPLIDTFTILWCCPTFFDNYKSKWNGIETLFSAQLGNRYLTKIKISNPPLIQSCNNMLRNLPGIFTIGEEKKNPSHFGMIFKEEPNMSKEPVLSKYDMMMCMQMCCTQCQTERCTGKQPCEKLFKAIMQTNQFLNQLKQKKDITYVQQYMQNVAKSNIVIPAFLKIDLPTSDIKETGNESKNGNSS